MSKNTIGCILAIIGLLCLGNDGLGRGFGGGGGGGGGGGRGGFGGGGGDGFGGGGGSGSVRYSGGGSSGFSGGADNTARPSNYGSIQNSGGSRGASEGWQTNSGYRPGQGQSGAWVSPGGNAAVVQGPRGGGAAAVDGPRGGAAAGARSPYGGSAGALQTAYGVRGGVVRGPAGAAAGAVRGPEGNAVAGARGSYGGRGVTALPSGYAATAWRGGTYYHNGHNFYRPYWYNNSVYYWPVSPPIGWFYPSLPSDAIQYSTDSGNYYYDDDTYYQAGQQDGQAGYTVVDNPSGAAPPQSDQPAPTDFASAPPDPFQTFKKACEFMGSQPRLTMTVDDTFDEVNDAGQKVQLSSERILYLQRPDKLAIDFNSDGQRRHMLYDGKQFTGIDLVKNLYCVITQQGTVDSMLDKLAKDYNMALPMDDLLYTNTYDRLASKIEAGQYAGQDTVEGVACDHVAFRQQGLDWDAWIQQGATPMIRKVSVTYSDMAGAPRYVMEVTKWLTDPIAPSAFQLELPKDAKQIDILAAIKTAQDKAGALPAAAPAAE